MSKYINRPDKKKTFLKRSIIKQDRIFGEKRIQKIHLKKFTCAYSFTSESQIYLILIVLVNNHLICMAKIVKIG